MIFSLSSKKKLIKNCVCQPEMATGCSMFVVHERGFIEKCDDGIVELALL